MLRIASIFALVLFSSGSGLSQAQTQAPCSASTFENDTNIALNACEAVLNQPGLSDSDRGNALKVRGRALHRLGKLEDAISSFQSALLFTPNDPELYVRRGWTAFDERNVSLVFEMAERALALQPDYAAAYELIGTTFVLGGREHYAEALSALEKAIQLDPKFIRYSFRRATLLRDMGQTQAALNEVDRLLTLPVETITKPSATEHSYKWVSYRIAFGLERANLFIMMGRRDAARDAYDAAVAADMHPLTLAWRAKFNIGRASADIRSAAFHQVQDDIQRSIAMDPDLWVSRETLGHIHYYSGEYREAELELAHAIALNPTFGGLRWFRAHVLRKLGRIDEAADEALMAFRVDPEFGPTKIGVLRRRGYLDALKPGADVLAALRDATRACMLDEQCM